MEKKDWISIDKELPENKEIVLVAIPDDILKWVYHVVEFSFDEYNGDHVWQTINGSHPSYTFYGNVVGVTHFSRINSPL